MKHLRLLFAALTIIVSVGTSAQVWTNAELADGKYILQNVATGRYMGPANAWGTQASLIENSHWNTLAKVDDGIYTIESQVSNGGSSYYFNGSYMDQGATNITIQKNQSGYYSLSLDGMFIGYNGSDYIISSTLNDQNAKAALWQIIAYDDFLEGASEETPRDATYRIACPNFDRNHRYSSAWTMQSSNQNLSGGDNTNRCAESWRAAFTLTQKINDLPNGVYHLRAQAAITDYAEAYDGNNYPVVYAGNANTPFKDMDVNDRGTDMGTLSASFTAGKYYVNWIEAIVTDGTLTIGTKGTRTDTWCIWDNFQLEYLGPVTDITPLVNAYLQALANARELSNTQDKIAPSVLANLNAVIAAYDESKVDQTSKSAVEEATAALNEAIALANNSIANYKLLASLTNGMLPNNSIDGWVCTNTNTFEINTWSVEGDSDGTGMETPFIQNWVYLDSTLGDGTISYTLTGLEPGEQYFISALVRVYSESGTAPNGPTFFTNNDTFDLTTTGTAFEFNNMLGYYATIENIATVGEDGVLTLGVSIENANYNWVAIRNVVIQDATTAFNFSKEKYYKLRPYAVNIIGEPTDNTNARTTLSNSLNRTDAKVEMAEDAITVSQAYNTLYEALSTYAAIANPTGNGQFDLNFLLTNPNLDGLPSWNKAAGWYTEESDGNSQVMVNNDKANGEKNAFYEYWSNPAKASGRFALYTKATLGTGIYKMSCYAFAEDQYVGTNVRGVKFFANDTEGSTIQSTILEPADIEFVNPESCDVKIGLKTTEGNTCNWMGIGYVQLYKLPSTKVATLTDNDTSAPSAGAYTTINYNRTLLAGLNTLVLPFATTKEELGADLVLEYKGSEQADGKTVLRFTAVESLEANKPYAIMMESQKTLTSFENKTVTEPTDLTVAGDEYSFVGTFTAYTAKTSPIVESDYIAVDKNFKRAKGGNVIKAYRGYLKKVGDSNSEVAFNFDGEYVDGITAAKMMESLGEEAIYNLNGQRVNTLQKGVYIVNGKKIVVK